MYSNNNNDRNLLIIFGIAVALILVVPFVLMQELGPLFLFAMLGIFTLAFLGEFDENQNRHSSSFKPEEPVYPVRRQRQRQYQAPEKVRPLNPELTTSSSVADLHAYRNVKPISKLSDTLIEKDLKV